MTGNLSSGAAGTTERTAGEWLQFRNRFRPGSGLMFTPEGCLISAAGNAPIEELTYPLSSTTGQEGCIVPTPDRDAFEQSFPGRTFEIGQFGFKFRGTSARQWIVTYRTKES
jgi:hypothetical protein